MEEVHRQVLKENLTYLQDNLSPESVLDELFAAGTISDDQLQRLRTKPTTKSCVRQLVAFNLPKAGSAAFGAFINALQANQQTQYISTHLLEQEKKVQQRSRKGNITKYIYEFCYTRNCSSKPIALIGNLLLAYD